jgi:hypothetical protein
MKRIAVIAVGLFIGCQSLTAREVTVTFWISGGAEGLLDGGRIAPGWLGLLSQLGDRPEEEIWIDVGGTRHLPELSRMESLRIPDAIVPGESLLRIEGAGFIQSAPHLGTNLGILPQFPEAERGFQSVITTRHPDGGELRILGLLSEQAPLRIPAAKLRPLRVLPVTQTLRDVFTQDPSPGGLTIVVLPERMSGSEASMLFPDAQVLVEQPGGAAQVIEVANGARLRVRPGRHGRSVIRVWARWNTVTKTFSAPKAEVVWVQPADYQKLILPDALIAALRDPVTFHPSAVAEVWWEPEVESMKEPSRRPDAVRAQRIPEDDVWMLAEVPADRWRVWRQVAGERWTTELERMPRSPRVAFPAGVAAGRGDWSCPIRQDILNGTVQMEELEHTLRDGVAVSESPVP